MKKSYLILFIFLFNFSGCNKLDNQEKCFLDFRLGMREYEFEEKVRKYIREGVIRETILKKPYEWKRILHVKFRDTKREGKIEPIFLTDRLDQLSIFFEEERSYNQNDKVMVKEYNDLLNVLKSDYGNPDEINKDSLSRHQLIIWEANTYKVSALFAPENDLWKDHIAIYFEPLEDLEEELEKYNTEKKLERQKY